MTYNATFNGTYQRYELYRLNPGGHNTLLMNANQTINAGIQKLAVKIDGVQETTIVVDYIPIYKEEDLNKPVLKISTLGKWEKDK